MNEATDKWRRERLQALSDKYEGHAPLGRAMGYKDGAYVRQMIAGERAISEKTINKAERLPGCAGWFAKDLPRIAGHPIALDVDQAPVSLLKPASEELVIKQYETGGSMGKGLILQGDQPGIIRNMIVTREWAQKNLRAHTGLQNLCIVTGFGDSMKPLFNPGDPLIVDQGVKSCDVDAVYFFRVGDEGFIKRLQRVPGEGVWALSANKEYKDWLIQRDADFEVFGRVLKAWKGEDL